VISTAKATSVKSGQCLMAIGSIAGDGTLDARSVSLRPPVNGNCPSRSPGFVGGFPPGGPPNTTAGGSGA
jgi:hypothetical protein